MTLCFCALCVPAIPTQIPDSEDIMPQDDDGDSENVPDPLLFFVCGGGGTFEVQLLDHN